MLLLSWILLQAKIMHDHTQSQGCQRNYEDHPKRRQYYEENQHPRSLQPRRLSLNGLKPSRLMKKENSV